MKYEALKNLIIRIINRKALNVSNEFENFVLRCKIYDQLQRILFIVN